MSSFIPRDFFASDVIPIAMSRVLRARSQSHSTCVQRQFACSEQKLSSITEHIEGENMSIEQSSFFLKARIDVLTFTSSPSFHSMPLLTCNSTCLMVLWLLCEKKSLFVLSVEGNTHTDMGSITSYNQSETPSTIS